MSSRLLMHHPPISLWSKPVTERFPDSDPLLLGMGSASTTRSGRNKRLRTFPRIIPILLPSNPKTRVLPPVLKPVLLGVEFPASLVTKPFLPDALAHDCDGLRFEVADLGVQSCGAGHVVLRFKGAGVYAGDGGDDVRVA